MNLSSLFKKKDIVNSTKAFKASLGPSTKPKQNKKNNAKPFLHGLLSFKNSKRIKKHASPNYKEYPVAHVATGKVITRIAPSPTGFLHVGTARSALFNYLFAKHYGGEFILRIEDTDKERSKKEFEDDILNGLEWLNISFDALYKQSDRTDVYQSYISKLIEKDVAYISKEKSKSDPKKEVEVVRLRNPKKVVTFKDMIRGDITFDTTELGDFVIAKSLKEPLYHLAVVIDDYEMKITHVIRGEDHISNTPRQILIQEALDIPRPLYAHIPLILAPDRSKMSKRGGATPIHEYRAKGYIPEAFINFLALLGWNPGTDQEIFNMKNLIKDFDITKIKKSGAVFNIEKLKWFNREYTKYTSENKFGRKILETIPESIKQLDGFEEKVAKRLISMFREKVITAQDVSDLAEKGELTYYFKKPSLDVEKILWKDETDKSTTRLYLQEVGALLEQIPAASFNAEIVKKAVWNFAEEKGRGAVLWPMRYALTGAEKSPDPFSVSYVLGKKETLERIGEAINTLAQ